MTSTTITRPSDSPADQKERPVNTSTITEPRPDVAPVGREPLAPDSWRPPDDSDTDVSISVDVDVEVKFDESLAARAPVARCADGNGTLVGLFFSDHVVDIARAKAMCALCPLAAGCLAGALDREEPWGVWGGELISGGRVIANKRPCGRPPKVARPEVVYDEMGPVEPARTVA